MEKSTVLCKLAADLFYFCFFVFFVFLFFLELFLRYIIICQVILFSSVCMIVFKIEDELFLVLHVIDFVLALFVFVSNKMWSLQVSYYLW